MRSFTTAAERVDEQAPQEWPFDIDGFAMTAYYPGDGQLAVLMAETGRHAETRTKIAGAINFFHSVLDDAGAAHVQGRLLDRTDPFGLPEVQDIMEWLVEEWTGRPTKSSSGSTPSRRTGGRKSTRPTPAST